MQLDENQKVEMRLRISKHTQQAITEFEKQYELRTYSAAVEKMCAEYEKLQKKIAISHTLDDMLQALSLLEASITEQIKQAARPAREARYNAALCLLLLNDMQYETNNKYHYDVDSSRLVDAKKQFDSMLDKARNYKQEKTDRQNWEE